MKTFANLLFFGLFSIGIPFGLSAQSLEELDKYPVFGQMCDTLESLPLALIPLTLPADLHDEMADQYPELVRAAITFGEDEGYTEAKGELLVQFADLERRAAYLRGAWEDVMAAFPDARLLDSVQIGQIMARECEEHMQNALTERLDALKALGLDLGTPAGASPVQMTSANDDFVRCIRLARAQYLTTANGAFAGTVIDIPVLAYAIYHYGIQIRACIE